MFTLALLAVFAPVGFPSALYCHVAVKPTICDMLLSHEKLGTDTLLPTPSESHEFHEFSWRFHICRFSIIPRFLRMFSVFAGIAV